MRTASSQAQALQPGRVRKALHEQRHCRTLLTIELLSVPRSFQMRARQIQRRHDAQTIKMSTFPRASRLEQREEHAGLLGLTGVVSRAARAPAIRQVSSVDTEYLDSDGSTARQPPFWSALLRHLLACVFLGWGQGVGSKEYCRGTSRGGCEFVLRKWIYDSL